MLDVNLVIENVNNNNYKGIIIRKFFHMIFISGDGGKLSIYTAVVFGGMTALPRVDERLLRPTYDDKVPCELQFLYNCKNENSSSDIIESINSNELTDSFCSQSDNIKKVWGDWENKTTQKDAITTLQKIYNDSKLKNISGTPTEGFYYVHQDNKSSSHNALARKASFKTNRESPGRFSLKSVDATEGLEFVSWIHTDISLNKKILDKRVRFTIQFGSENIDWIAYTPDFTWYFAPPPSYRVDIEHATISLGNGNEVQRNLLQEVSDDTTVLFKEWIKDEYIEDRRKARVNFQEYTSAYLEHKLSDKKEIKVTVSFINPERHAGVQFVRGIFVAIVLSFCSDKTRINDLHTCIQMSICRCGETCTCNIFYERFSVLFPFALLLSYLAFILKEEKYLSRLKMGHSYLYLGLKFSKYVGLVTSLILLMYTFIVWTFFQDDIVIFFLNNELDCFVNKSIVYILLVLSIISNIFYVFYCLCIRKVPLWKEL